MSVRTYNPSVRVGNWNEDIILEEDKLKDFLERREKGQLLTQQSFSSSASLLQSAELSISRDGLLRFGDKVALCCPGAVDRTKYFANVDPRDTSLLAVNGGSDISQSYASGTKSCNPTSRTTFVLKSVDSSADGDVVHYGQKFELSTLDALGNLLLKSDKVSFQNCTKKSRHQAVSLAGESSFLTQWVAKHKNPLLRFEYDNCPVLANEPVIITHSQTNQNLSVEQNHYVRSPMGSEYEVSAHTYLDSHKAEEDVNRWLFMMQVPGQDIYPGSRSSSKLPTSSFTSRQTTPASSEIAEGSKPASAN